MNPVRIYDMSQALYFLGLTRFNLEHIIQYSIPAEEGEAEPIYVATESEIELLSKARDVLVRIGAATETGRVRPFYD